MAVQRIEGENELAVHGVEDNPKGRRRRNPAFLNKLNQAIGTPIVDVALGAVGGGFVYVLAKTVYELVRSGPGVTVYERALVPAVIAGLGAFAMTRVSNPHAKNAGKVAIVVIAGLAAHEILETQVKDMANKVVAATGLDKMLSKPAGEPVKGNLFMLRGGRGYGGPTGDVLMRVQGPGQRLALAGSMR